MDDAIWNRLESMHESWDSACIVTDGRCYLTTVCKCTRDQLQDRFFMITAEIVLIIFVMDDVIWFFGENVCMTHSRTIKFYDYSWDGAYIVMGDAIWKSFALVRITHSRTIRIYGYSRDGAYIVLDDAILNRL